ncbi:MAG: DUF4125 family protein, partial [Oscillospiraceae bacterium]|nr:DUF4125 family protein [Oscillospiraceae bacterium]
MAKAEIIREIINIEWGMFHAVNGDGPKASCQNDPETFVGMRSAQFDAWNEETCASYLDDLNAAIAENRNLDTEKYIHMMRNTEPLGYEKFKEQLHFPDAEGMEYVEKITDKMINQTVEMFSKYPYVSGCGRPVYSYEDFGGTTSIETYQKGELMTYSTKTLKLLWEHIEKCEAEGIHLAKEILANGVRHYGYKGLDDAEAAMKEYVESLPIEMSFGSCGSCGSCGCGDSGCGDSGCGGCC